jgi:hypothetical protein
MPWYWDYRDDYAEGQHRTSAGERPSQIIVPDTRLRTSIWANTLYFHCPHCGNGYYSQDIARSCCGDVMRERRYLARRANLLQRMRFSITLDMTAL